MSTATKKAIARKFSALKREYNACVKIMDRCIEQGTLR